MFLICSPLKFKFSEEIFFRKWVISAIVILAMYYYQLSIIGPILSLSLNNLYGLELNWCSVTLIYYKIIKNTTNNF